ncbi:MAG: hypothetical protein HYY32_00655 [Chloroflexi bacterium]|nr:hypothetical protein [Chloroflexota bacterium]
MVAKMRGKWFLKACTSCGGDMYLDIEAHDLKCLQCGRSFSGRSASEQAALRDEVGHGRKVRLPMS